MKRLSCWFALLLLAAASANGQQAKKPLTIELVTRPQGLMAPGLSSVKWRPGSQEISYLKRQGFGRGAGAGGTIFLYDIATGKERVLLESPGGTTEGEKPNLSSYQWSPGGDALLLEGEKEIWIYDLSIGQMKSLIKASAPIEHATFSPTGERVAFVEENNLFSLDIKTGHRERLTNDGNDHVMNGKFDWVYEEELSNRATGRAFEWSPDGKKIAYLRLDDAPVPQYPLTHYLSDHVNLAEERFPQSGDPNPVPSFHVVSLEGSRPQTWTASVGKSVEYFGPSFSWTPDSKAGAFLTLNRAQDELEVHLWDAAAGTDRLLLTEKDASWINSLEPPRFLADNQRFLWLSERDGWLHLYLYDKDGRLQKQLTHGNWMIDHPGFPSTPIIGLDEKGGWVYFASTNPDPRERHLYRVRLEGGGLKALAPQPGVHGLNLSPDGQYLLDAFSSLNDPPETRLLKADGSLLATLSKQTTHLDEYALGKTELVEVKAPDGATLYARLVKPPDFDPAKKYPVIIDVYGGPHAQLIQNHWGLTSLSDHLYAEQGFIIWSLDNRGSWGRGHAWESRVFKNLGHYELEDQLAGVAYLKSLPYVDPGRIGIHGWSYGGYMTLYALTHAPEVFKCGAAGGPVTDWKFYDSIYTERYMRTPLENPEGYKTASPLEAADKLKAKVLLIHGTDDDNVHMQNTLNFVEALVKARTPFELYIQPGEKHGFASEAARLYLAQRMLEFFKQNL